MDNVYLNGILMGISALNITFTVSIYAKTNKLKRKMIIKRLSTENITIDHLPSAILEANEKRLNNYPIEKYNNLLNTFYNVIYKRIPNVNLNAFIENTKGLMIIEKFNDKEALKKGYSAEFVMDYRSPKIMLYREEIQNCIFHEMMHMASSRILHGMIYCGFHQCGIDEYGNHKSIGSGLNEGYTEILAYRYFRDYGHTYMTYRFLAEIALILEQNFLDRYNMEHWYFEGDLHSLSNALLNYDTYDNVLSFFKKLDFIKSCLNTNDKLEAKICNDVTDDVLNTLLKWYKVKINNFSSKEVKLNEQLLLDSFKSSYDVFKILDDTKSKKLVFVRNKARNC